MGQVKMEHYFIHRISVHALEVLLYNYCYMKKTCFSDKTLLTKANVSSEMLQVFKTKLECKFTNVST